MMEEVELQIPVSTQKNQDIQTTKNANGLKLPADSIHEEKGLTLWTGALFIFGEMAGSGVLALPFAVLNAGWAGLAMIAVFCATSGYSGTRLSACWIMLEERHEAYQKQVRNPYPSIGYEAYGRWMRVFVSICIKITLFGVGTVLLLLSARLIGNLFSGLWHASPCLWILIIACALTPFMWLGTPKDFWPVAIGASATTAVACFMIVIRSCIDGGPVDKPVEYPNPTFSSFSLAFGAILFSYGGASTFPTIQNDMKDRAVFSKSVLIAFLALALCYIPVAACGYTLFGNAIQSNILETLTNGPDTMIVEVLLAAHLLFAFIIIINPFCQAFEHLFKVPEAFGWRRCLLRTSVMVLIVFVGESVPNFSKILNLVGGSTITLMTFIFPPLFYMRLVDTAKDTPDRRRLPIFERVFLWLLVVIGVLGGTASTYNSILEIVAPDAFSVPCYLSMNLTQN